MVNSPAGDAQSEPRDYYAEAGASKPPSLRTPSAHVAREILTPDAMGIVLVLVGLPARGKSFISNKLERFLRWKGLRTQMFNVGKYRRNSTAVDRSGRSSFFDAGNDEAMRVREECATAALTDVIAFLDAGGQVAIFDATNSTVSRRASICDRLAAHEHRYTAVFLETVCTDEHVLEANMLSKVNHSPDFKHMSSSEALADLKARIAKYEEVYETVGDSEGQYIKLFDLSSKVLANHIYGRTARILLPYLMGVHIGSRPIWLVRAGVGQANPQGPGVSCRSVSLSRSGHSFGVSLVNFVQQHEALYWADIGTPQEPTQVFTSTMPRAVDSAHYVTDSHLQLSALNPLDHGAIGAGWWDVGCSGDVPPWEEVERRHPDFWRKFSKDPLKCRFPGGECYMDVVERLESFVIEAEMCTRPVLIVSHVMVLQILMAYFRGQPLETAWSSPVSRNTVFEAVPNLGGGFICQEYVLEVDDGAAAPDAGAGIFSVKHAEAEISDVAHEAFGA